MDYLSIILDIKINIIDYLYEKGITKYMCVRVCVYVCNYVSL